MEAFLKEVISWEQFELVIDSKIFNKDIVLKAAYVFLDRWYFFFKIDSDKNMILQFTKKEDNKEEPKKIIWDFSDELLSTYLRDKLEHDNKDIREKIVWAAIANSLDSNNFASIDPNNNWDQDNREENQIDFDKDIDEILKEIENDPELKIDEAEIEKILKEIEEETESEIETPKPTITIDPEAVKKAKEQFKNK